MSYTLKFKVKRKEGGLDYKVMPLEGLWWTDNMADFSAERKDEWKWTMMVVQPSIVTDEFVEQAVTEAGHKKDLPALDKIRFQAFSEGLGAPDHASWPLLGRRPDDRKTARVHRRRRIRAGWQASRDLSWRPPPRHPCCPATNRARQGREGVNYRISRATGRP